MKKAIYKSLFLATAVAALAGANVSFADGDVRGGLSGAMPDRGGGDMRGGGGMGRGDDRHNEPGMGRDGPGMPGRGPDGGPGRGDGYGRGGGGDDYGRGRDGDGWGRGGDDRGRGGDGYGRPGYGQPGRGDDRGRPDYGRPDYGRPGYGYPPPRYYPPTQPSYPPPSYVNPYVSRVIGQTFYRQNVLSLQALLALDYRYDYMQVLSVTITAQAMNGGATTQLIVNGYQSAQQIIAYYLSSYNLYPGSYANLSNMQLVLTGDVYISSIAVQFRQ